MIKSMTGFGRVTKENSFARIDFEIKSLNSKFMDLSLRLPRDVSDKEVEMRNLITQRMERGKVSAYVDISYTSVDTAKSTINKDLFKHYYAMIIEATTYAGAPSDGLVQNILSMPDVIVPNRNPALEEELVALLQSAANEAIARCDEFRITEGKALESKFVEYIQNISDRLVEVEKLDPNRIQNIKNKLQTSIEELKRTTPIDSGRFEQELIFYIEKLDITEEKVRLKNHLDFFIKNLHSKENSGKKLGFIAQELGREINTIGSKSNDAEMQKCVVEMKDELEKIKEQLNNIL